MQHDFLILDVFVYFSTNLLLRKTGGLIKYDASTYKGGLPWFYKRNLIYIKYNLFKSLKKMATSASRKNEKPTQ